ncbi:MAG: CC0125/CC1285 family lipoprotein [Allorhizobium sp.]
MKKLRTIIAAAAPLLVTGCQTPYQAPGPTGGVTAAPITNDTFRVSARGNGYTDASTVQDYTLLKAAEVTLAQGATHFMVLGANDVSRNEIGSTPDTMQTNVFGNTAFTTYNPGVTYNIVKPGQDVIIKVLKLPAGVGSPPGAFNAQEVYDNISPRVVRPK